jgi:hypothetical protein
MSKIEKYLKAIEILLIISAVLFIAKLTLILLAATG